MFYRLETIVNSFTEKKVLENQLLVVLQKRCWSVYILGWRQIKNVCIIIIMFFIKLLMEVYIKIYLLCNCILFKNNQLPMVLLDLVMPLLIVKNWLIFILLLFFRK